MRVCSIEGCTGDIRTRGWCSKHYSRYRAHGSPHAEPERDPHRRLTFDERMSRHVEVTGFCWLWAGGRSSAGYGIVSPGAGDSARSRLAHRWVYAELVGPIPDGLELDHLCRVRNCVNPDHLEPVTPAENNRRALRHARRRTRPWDQWWPIPGVTPTPSA